MNHGKEKVMALDRTSGDRGTPVLVKVALIIAIIGAVNWGLIGFFNFNLVDAIFGGDAREMTSAASRVVYAIVGLAGLASLAVFSRQRAEHHRMDPAPHSR
jgi:uncharacterized membrane protein YuzA (DUF378 family)